MASVQETASSSGSTNTLTSESKLRLKRFFFASRTASESQVRSMVDSICKRGEARGQPNCAPKGGAPTNGSPHTEEEGGKRQASLDEGGKPNDSPCQTLLTLRSISLLTAESRHVESTEYSEISCQHTYTSIIQQHKAAVAQDLSCKLLTTLSCTSTRQWITFGFNAPFFQNGSLSEDKEDEKKRG